MQHDRTVYRSTFGRVLTVAIGATCATVMVALVATSGWTALRALPWLALVAGACWAMFWRPEVAVDDGGVRLVNVLRTIDVPWPSIHAVDTKWALTLITAYGKFTAWAAPGPGIHESLRSTRRDAEVLPASTFTAEGVRPGDLPSTSSGAAAMVVRQRWQALREAGHLEDPQLERESASVEWHLGTVVAAALIGSCAVVALVL